MVECGCQVDKYLDKARYAEGVQCGRPASAPSTPLLALVSRYFAFIDGPPTDGGTSGSGRCNHPSGEDFGRLRHGKSPLQSMIPSLDWSLQVDERRNWSIRLEWVWVVQERLVQLPSGPSSVGTVVP